MSGLLPTIIFPGDIRAVQQRLLASAQGTNASLCANAPANVQSAWGAFYQRVQQYATPVPATIPWGQNEIATTSSYYEAGLELEQELYAWQQKISGYCALALPAIDPNAQHPELPFVTALRWGTFLALTVAGAYVVHETLPLVTHLVAMRPKRNGAAKSPP